MYVLAGVCFCFLTVTIAVRCKWDLKMESQVIAQTLWEKYVLNLKVQGTHFNHAYVPCLVQYTWNVMWGGNVVKLIILYRGTMSLSVQWT